MCNFSIMIALTKSIFFDQFFAVFKIANKVRFIQSGSHL
jgi:hypothetical protein